MLFVLAGPLCSVQVLILVCCSIEETSDLHLHVFCEHKLEGAILVPKHFLKLHVQNAHLGLADFNGGLTSDVRSVEGRIYQDRRFTRMWRKNTRSIETETHRKQKSRKGKLNSSTEKHLVMIGMRSASLTFT